MSAISGLLKAASHYAEPVRKTRIVAPAPVPASLGPQDTFVSLARQVFFSGTGIIRRRVLFAAADRETQIAVIGEQVARAAASMRATVALVDSRTPEPTSGPTSGPVKKPALGTRGAGPRPEVQIAERLWRISLDTLLDIENTARSTAELFDPFGCVLFTAIVSDRRVPQFCELCDAAVLVVTTEHTRRDTAVRAKQVLEQLNVKLLGTVVARHGFPIPSSIYQRL